MNLNNKMDKDGHDKAELAAEEVQQIPEPTQKGKIKKKQSFKQFPTPLKHAPIAGKTGVPMIHVHRTPHRQNH